MLKLFRICIGLIILTLMAFSQVNVWAEERKEEVIEELQAKIKFLEAQIKRIEKEKEDNLKKYNECMENRITDANEIKKLNLQINEEKDKIQKVKEEMTKKEEELKKEIESLNETIKEKEESIKNIQTQLVEKVKILKEREVTIEESNKKVSQLELQIQQLTTLSKEKEDKLTNCSEKLSMTEKNLAEKETELADYKAKEDEIEKLRLEIEKEKTTCQNLTQKMTRQLEDNKKLYEEYTVKIRELTSSDSQTKLFGEERQKRQNYISQLYALHLNEINQMTISELNYYLANYPELEKADEFLYLIGDLYKEEKKNYLAIASFLKLITLYPDSKFIPKAKLEIKKLEKSIDKNFYKKIEKLPSSTSNERMSRFFIYLNDLHTLSNEKLYQYCLEQQEEFLKLYKDSKEAVDVYRLMAETYLRLKENEKAIATYLKIPLLYPLYPEVSRLADAYYAIGDTFANGKEYNQAIVFYEKAITLLPEYQKVPSYLLTTAQFYKDKLKQVQNVISTYNRLVSNYPNSQEAVTSLSQLGQFYERLKRYQDAIKTYEYLVKEYPKSSLAPSSLKSAGECYEKMTDYSNAISTYLSLANEYPNYEETPQQLFKAGELYEKNLNDVTKALEIYQKIIDKYPANKLANSANRKIKQLTK